MPPTIVNEAEGIQARTRERDFTGTCNDAQLIVNADHHSCFASHITVNASGTEVAKIEGIEALAVARSESDCLLCTKLICTCLCHRIHWMPPAAKKNTLKAPKPWQAESSNCLLHTNLTHTYFLQAALNAPGSKTEDIQAPATSNCLLHQDLLLYQGSFRSGKTGKVGGNQKTFSNSSH